MPTVVTKDELRTEFYRVLGKDARTDGHVAEAADAVFIVEAPFPSESNWRLADWEPMKRLSPELHAAVKDAETELQAKFQLPTVQPLGGTATSM